MNKNFKISLLFIILLFTNKLYSQCNIVVDVANLGHITCPNGGATGTANILQTGYQSFTWFNISNGQIYGNGPGITSAQNLHGGFYVVQGSDPYNISCPFINYSDTFEIIEPVVDIQSYPTQACPGLCNVAVDIEILNPVSSVSYSVSLDNNIQNIGIPFVNQCGGNHQYEILADGVGCGIQNFGISQFAQMNLNTIVNNITCLNLGSATVNITGVGASGINTYCASSSQYDNYSTIDNVQLIGNSSSINNTTTGQCDQYQDYTNIYADVSPGNQYIINISLGTCHPQSIALVDLAKIYIDWNIDGDFNDLYELVGQVSAQQSPSSHSISFTVPVGAIPGQSRMRIVSQNSQYQSTNQALSCDYNTAWFGSTEDYTIEVSGSVANPVSYLWSNGQTTQTATNLNVGAYMVTITDANGCTASDTTDIAGSGSLITNIHPVLQMVCKGQVADTLIVTSVGDSGPYQYQWLNYPVGLQSNQATIIPNAHDSFFIPSTSNIGLEFFYCIVTSGTGCIDTTNIISFEVVKSPEITKQPRDTSVCIDANLTINIEDTFFVNVAANTITPVYQWYQNSICDITSSIPAIGLGNNTEIYTPQTALPGTTYYFCVVNIPQIVGCNTDTSVCAEVIVNPIPTVLLTALPSPACEGDNIQLIANTSIPVNRYRFQYNGGSGWQNILTNTPWGWGTTNPMSFSNITTTTQFRARVMEGWGCNPSTWSPVLTVPVYNVVTSPISHN